MPRKPEIRYFESRQGYYTQHRKKQTKLATGPDDRPDGPTYLAALDAFRELMSGEVEPGKGKTVASVWDAYHRFLQQGNREETTVSIHVDRWTPFVALFGTLPVAKLTHPIVYDWLAEKRKPRKHPLWGHEVSWGDGTVRMVVTSLQAGFNWAIKAGLIAKNPLKGIEKPSACSRGEEALVSDEDHVKVLASTKGAFRDLCICLEATGARPSELTTATAKHFDPAKGAIVHKANPEKGQKRHKTARKTGKDRIIYLRGEALEVVRRRVEQFPSGPLFGAVPRGSDGRILRRWTSDQVSCYFQKLRKRTGLTLTAYSYRHTISTRWMMAGKPPAKLAELLGNSVAVILKHYSHLAPFGSDLGDELAAFLEGKPA